MNQNASRSRAPRSFDFLSAPQVLRLPYLRWAVRGIFPQDSLAAVYGASGVAKSVVCLDLSAKLAIGEYWFGYHVAKDLRVALFVLEGKSGLRQRVEAWQKFSGREMPNRVHFFCGSFSINDADDVKRAAASLEALGGVDAIVIDTLNRASPGADENRSDDMGRIIDGASRLQQLTSSLVILVHHPGKDEGRGLRGHSSLHAALDVVVEVKRNKDGDRWWELVKSKDGADGASFKFELAEVDLDVDEFGLTRSSVAIQETAEPGPSQEERSTLGKNQAAVLAQFKTLLAAKAAPDKAAPGATGEAGIGLDAAVAGCKDCIEVADNSRRSERTKDAIKSLIRAGRIEDRGGMLYLPA